jgi:hypothetical protein
VLLALAVPPPAAADANWWNASWTARRTLTFSNGGQAENLVGFPVLVKLDAGDIDYTKVQGAGQDLRFVDADNLAVLPHQIESWTVGGPSWVWVRVPQIDASSTTDFIYMYYGNPSAADGQNGTGVWDTDFKMVLHLPETGGAHQDSTTNNNDGVVVNVASRGVGGGQVNGADFFNSGSAENVDVNDAASLDMAAGDSFTLEAWVNTTMGGWGVVFSKEDVPTSGQYQLWVNAGVPDLWLVDDGGTGVQATSSVSVNNGAWRYLVGRWNETTGRAEIFVDGVLRGGNGASLGSITTATPLVIGEEGDVNAGGGARGGNFHGGIDEVRISKTARSDAWIRAQHLSMIDAFITFGDEPVHRFTDVTAKCGLSFGRSPLDKVSQRKIVRDKDGNRYLVFGRFRDTGGCAGYQEIRLARSTDDGATWTEVALFGQGGIAWNTATNGFMYPALDTNSARDELHVVVQHYSGQRLLYTKNVSLANWDQAAAWTCAAGGRNSGGTCVYDGAEQVNSTSVYGESAPAIAVDGDGLPHVAFEGWAGSGSNRGVRWRFYRPGLGSWSPEDLVTNDSCTSANRDVSIEASRGLNDSAVVQSRVHFLYKQDADCTNTVDTLRYAFAVRTGVETYSAVTRLPGTGSGFPPFTYLWISNGTGPGRVAQGASITSQGGRLWAVGGFDSPSGTTVKMAYSTTNGDTWEVGAAGGVAVAGANFAEGYPAVGASAGFDHRIMSGLSAAGSSAQLGYQWHERSRAFRYRTQLQGDATAGETGDYAHLTLEKRRPLRSSDFAYCWYVSTNNGAPPPNLLVDEIRCNVDPTVMYRSIAAATGDFTYAVGTVSATNGSRIVDGSGTAWRTANRGRGDRLDIDGTQYTVDTVLSNTSLVLTTRYLGSTGGGKTYLLSRQFNQVDAWEDCIDGPTSSSCTYLKVTSGSLVSDNRIEVGVAYDDGQDLVANTDIQGSTTDFVHTITLTAAPGNRHIGIRNTGIQIVSVGAFLDPIIDIRDRNVTVEWLSLAAGTADSNGAIRVDVDDPAFNGPVVIRNNILFGLGSHGIVVGSTTSQNILLDIHNNVLRPTSANAYYAIRLNPSGSSWNPGSEVYISNNTVFPGGTTNDYGIQAVPADNSAVTLVNNIAHSWDIECIQVPNPNAASNFNLVGPRDLDLDGSCTTAPGGSSLVNVPLTGAGGANFVDPGPAGNYHLQASSVAIDLATTLANTHVTDIDGGVRPAGAAWDIGADEYGATTAVTLMSFDAVPSSGAVELVWRTGSEVDNLGFHVHRALTAEGPWTRLTSSLIPGLGFSPMGGSYAWRDAGLQNGVRYFYRLEDVDSKSVSGFHGPVSAVPGTTAPPVPPEGGGGEGGEGEGGSGEGESGTGGTSCPGWALARLGSSSSSYTCETHGTPGASFRVLSRSARSATVELRTTGFLTARDSSGRVRALVPGLDTLSEPLAPALPLKRALLDGVVGRKARIRSVEARDLRGFPGLLPAAVGYPEALVSADGVVRPGRREAVLPDVSRGYLPREQARLAGEGFRGEEKTLTLEMVPLRFDAYRSQLVLARRLVVRIDFAGREVGESGQGRYGRRVPRTRPDSNAYAFLGASRTGLHAVAFESLFPGRTRPLDLASLRLTKDAGRALVPFHVLPQGSSFGPGSRLFFLADQAPLSTSFSFETVYALERGTGGLQMSLGDASPDGLAGVSSRATASFETNRLFAPDLLDAADLWQWESMNGGVSKTKSFDLPGLDSASSEAARLTVFLQGGSDALSVVDHHVQVFLNGALVAEDTFDGAVPRRLEVDVPASLLLIATLDDPLPNDLIVKNLNDTGVTSRVFLDRFDVLYPQTASARSGAFDGVFSSAGAAEIAGLASPAALVDTTAGVSWLTGFETGGSVRFRAEAGHRYLAVSQDALLAPRVFFPEPSARLRSTTTQADYVLVAPQAFMAAAQPLLEQRASQGLSTFAASLEEIASSFGGGQASAQAIRDFLSFAWHRWQRPSPRYVLLLGDSNYDPRHFLASSQASPLPFLLHRTSYIWTASDPALASVNGDDLLPDFAIGRLPATTLEQAQTMIAKVLDFEDLGLSFDGKVALVADNPDLAGDFEADVNDVEASFLQGRDTTKIFLGQLGSRDVARTQILDAFNQGLSLISYVGHGGGAVWANENMLNSQDPLSLQAQPRQPLMLTMNCLNGYFVAPSYESLAEGFLKAPGKGTIAAFSPSGLSLDGPAHLYHRAVMGEITSGQHERLGDALLAAQKAYAETGAMPELLAIYHLFADPAMKVQ